MAALVAARCLLSRSFVVRLSKAHPTRTSNFKVNIHVRERHAVTLVCSDVSTATAKRRTGGPSIDQHVRRFGSERPTGASTPKATFTWKAFAISSAILAIFFGGAFYYKKQKELQMNKDRRRSLGKAAIGGQFSLIDHNGKPFSSEDLRGKWVLLYFGFSHCPDICPEEMEKMVKVIDKLEKTDSSINIVPLFITVDPERDSPQVVASYIKEFSSKIIGLTGTKEQIDAATKAYRVYYSAGPREGNDYIVDHTIIMYLINPDGEFVDYYGQLKTADQVVNGVLMSSIKYNQLKKKSWFS